MMSKATACGMQIDEAVLKSKKANPHGKLEDFHTGFWNFRGKNVRTIDEGSRIHTSVIQRRTRASNKYNPKNLPRRFDEVS